MRRVLAPLVALALSAATAPPSAGAQAGPSADGYEVWYRGLRELAPDPERGAEVRGITLQRDVATFHLDEGRVQALRDVGGRTVGVAFRGRGRFTMPVTDPVEAAETGRMLGSSEVDPDIRSAVFLFTDFTISELQQAGLAWTPLPIDREMERDVREVREYFTDGDGWVSRSVLLPLINAGPAFFYAHVAEDRNDPLIFTYDPHDAEEVTLSVKADRAKRPVPVTRFHRRSDYETGRSIPQEALDLIRVTGYDIDTRVRGNLDLEARATMAFERLQARYSWIPFRLFYELQVDSVVWGDGTPARFHRPKEATDLWVDFGTMPGGVDRLTFHYRGDMMDRPQGLWIQIASHTGWYPVYEYDRPIPYRLTFRTPTDLAVATVGTRTSSATADGETVTTWETPPVRQLTFNIGDFDRFESAPPGPDDPGLTVLVNEGAHRRLGDLAFEAGYNLLEQRDMSEMVAIDLRASFAFYNRVYGPTTVRDFVATEIPYNHGEAYPGLVMLAWNTFQWTSSSGFDELFRAHEVAHQWWGIGVRPATYRDWWIAEGFSEFSGLWYAARARGSVDMYYKRLKETREALLKRRSESPPIALGTRIRFSDHPEDYEQTIYQKGAWVLHMLRTLLTDHDTGSDDRFTAVMRTFWERHKDGSASTASFQAVAEEVVGSDLDWFFQQWVYGSDIPTYRFAHRYEQQPDGSVKATVRVRQERVPDGFQMLVPVLVDFGADGSAVVPIAVAGPESVVELPLLPRVPDRIEFNPYEAVLAETRTEGWN